MDYKCKSPVLLVVFKRLEATKLVFDAIRQIQPLELYVFADGPRLNVAGEKEKCEEVRKYILDGVDWDCEVKTLFQDDNMGCGTGPYKAIKWFFDNVEMGILLEDDVIPNKSFFPYCEELLQKYRYDTRISMIGGFNLFDKEKTSNTYYFSKYVLTSGAFASWRRAWKDYDFSISKWKQLRKTDFIHIVYPIKYIAKYYADLFDDVFNGNRNDAWDYQWSFLNLVNDWKCILPCCNLIKNIGFGEDATHTVCLTNDFAKLYLNLPEGEINFPLRHPISYNTDIIRDNAYLKSKVSKPKPLVYRVIRKGYRILKKVMKRTKPE